jgi:hypothetical protein
MSKIYAIQFNAAGLDYVRQVLGNRPHDEVGLLIRSIEQQRTEQDNPPPAMEQAAAPAVATAIKRPRAHKAARAAALNGAGSHAPSAS